LHVTSSGQIMTKEQGSAGMVWGLCDLYGTVPSEVRDKRLEMASDVTGLCSCGNSLDFGSFLVWILARSFFIGPVFCGLQQYWSLYAEVRWQGHDGDHSSPYSTDVKNEWSYTSAPPCSVDCNKFTPFFWPYSNQTNAWEVPSCGREPLCFVAICLYLLTPQSETDSIIK
jgi:hypothetical protein